MKKILLLIGLVFVLFPIYLFADLNKGLVAFFPFNGNANDESGKGNKGTIHGATLTEDRFENANGAYYFDGKSYLVYRGVKNIPIGKAKRTLALWAKSADGFRNGNADHIANWGSADSGNAFGLMIFEKDNWWGFGYYPEFDLDSDVTADTEWHFFCVTYDSVEMKIYIDGRLAAVKKMTLNTKGNDLYIGIRPDEAMDNTFDGVIDDIYIYNRVLTDTEIQELYAKKPLAPAMGKNLIINGDFEQGEGVNDDSSDETLPVPGWNGSGKYTALQYGCDNCQDKDTPGPEYRGKNYLIGGPDNKQSSASQTIDVSALAGTIDTGNVTYVFEGWLGGYESQEDYTTVTANFTDNRGKSLGKATIGPVNTEDRNGETISVLKSAKGDLPKGTRSIIITVVLTRTEGSYNDASADNLSLVLVNK